MEKSSLIVELAGPAGAGKSTLAKALNECDRNIRTGVFPNVRDVRNFPFFLWNTILLLPVFHSIGRDRLQGVLTRQQIATMAILKGWYWQLQGMDSPRSKIVILDQGPVYMLSDLLRFGPANLRQRAPRWWSQTCRDWAGTLTLVVCLDAPDEVLLDRVRHRGKMHGFKRDTDDKAKQFLARCRLTQNEALSSMCANSGSPKVIYFDTSKNSLAEVAEKALELLQDHTER